MKLLRKESCKKWRNITWNKGLREHPAYIKVKKG